MFSIKGIFLDNKIHLTEPLYVKKAARIIVTLAKEGQTLASQRQSQEDEIQEMWEQENEEESEDRYLAVRKHKRFRANGYISIVEGDYEETFPLFDYSAGGLSFVSDYPFEPGKVITASIKDPIDKESSILDFEFEVARSIEQKDRFKIGCRFFDEMDEELWHSLVS